MKNRPIETALAQRFAAALRNVEPSRSRVGIEAYSAAFLIAEPALATSPDRRARLCAAIEELLGAGVITVSRIIDRSELPPLPRFIVPLDRINDPPVGRESASYPWRPELVWAARLPLRRSEFDALRAIQTFLRDQGDTAPIVPVGERSLELFGDEKRLDVLRRNRRLFGTGRLSLAILRTRLFAPPFAYRRLGTGSVALVVENVATYHSILTAAGADGPVGLVIFGAGGNFAASVCYLSELTSEGPASNIREIRYFGDLDRRGLEIPIAADAAARDAGLPAVRPAIGLWARLLRANQRASYPSVDLVTAERLVSWLPPSLRHGAREVLVSGARLAQEAVGTRLLANDASWNTWAGLGPPGLERPTNVTAANPAVVSQFARTSFDALVLDDDGNRLEPQSETEWKGWVEADKTKNWVLGDPILDWLDLYGDAAGFKRDDQRGNYELRTDFHTFVLEKSRGFKAALMQLLSNRIAVVPIAESPIDSQSLSKARATIEAMRSGVPVIAQAVFRNPARRVYGVVDLLMRSDLLVSWFPELISPEEAATPAQALGLSQFHYRPINVRFHTFDLTADGHISGSPEQLAYAAQLWLCAEALSRMQGYEVATAYLLGRTWQQDNYRGSGCLERLGRVDLNRWLPGPQENIGHLAQESVEWVRKLRDGGAGWSILPEPSEPELYPHARNLDDSPWHSAKKEIATALHELTLLPAINPGLRRAAHTNGIRKWSDAKATASRLGVSSPIFAARLDAVLAANQASKPAVVPNRIHMDSGWRTAARVEFYVDFETVSNLDDDFTSLPRVGGQPLIVQIGCGRTDTNGVWHFSQWSVEAITREEERTILEAWFAEMKKVCDAAGITIAESRIFHWSAAEPANLESSYNAACTRHKNASWPMALPWFDLLERLIRAEPVAVTGAFNFGLKAIAKAMHAAGFISTTWMDSTLDGLGAMTAVWSAAHDTSASGQSLAGHRLMIEVGKYNEVDCRTMFEILKWLRSNR